MIRPGTGRCACRRSKAVNQHRIACSSAQGSISAFSGSPRALWNLGGASALTGHVTDEHSPLARDRATIGAVDDQQAEFSINGRGVSVDITIMTYHERQLLTEQMEGISCHMQSQDRYDLA